jgi:hypothetical protein
MRHSSVVPFPSSKPSSGERWGSKMQIERLTGHKRVGRRDWAKAQNA